MCWLSGRRRGAKRDHEGAVRMAQTEIDSGQSEPAVHLAHDIVDTQQREIDTMKQILGR